jgi:hypothetical protein
MGAEEYMPNKKLAVAGACLSIAGMILRLAAIRRRDRPLSPLVVVVLLFIYAVTWLLVVFAQAFVGTATAILWALIRHALRAFKRPSKS